MAEVSNVFDLVTTRVEPRADQSRVVDAKRSCNYRSRLGTPCKEDALDGAMVCAFHKGGASALRMLRRQLLDMAPDMMETLEELRVDDNGLVRLGALKLWTDLTGMKDLPQASNIDEEELDAARRSLSHKLEAVAERVLQRKTA